MNKKIITPLIIVILLTLITSTAIADDINVDITPQKPQAMGTIDLTVSITNQAITNPEGVYVIIQECNANNGICYTKENTSMSKDSEDVYSANINLNHDDATYLQYTIKIQTATGWNTYQENTKLNYQSSSNGNGGDTNGGNDSPGFEFIIIALSIIFITMMMYKRKR